ncbi:hypothetical protein VTP01DRAFT_7875 [Rhizomucor pusillus]|uniref:uncharacterized protein n=1 Tax=Rhizomucor pusillus TaxID=4840 RepID=UPI0037449C83
MSLKRLYSESAAADVEADAEALDSSSSQQRNYTMGAKQSTQPSQTKRSKRSFSQSSKASKQSAAMYAPAAAAVYTEHKYTPHPHSPSCIPTPPPPPAIPQFDTRQCELWFQQYADPDMPDTISPEGTQQFFEDLGFSLDDITVLILAWKMNIANMGYITKDEWMQGMQSLDADCKEKLLRNQSAIDAIKEDPKSIRDIYNYSFAYAKDKNQKCMDVDVACVLWGMILGAKYPLVNDFVSFLQQVQPVKVINKDQWHNFYDFVTSISPDLDDYDEMSAWPVLFDEFVEWKRGMKNQQ